MGAEQASTVYVQCRMLKSQQRAQVTASQQAAINQQFQDGAHMFVQEMRGGSF
jgi:hypothetical protein